MHDYGGGDSTYFYHHHHQVEEDLQSSSRWPQCSSGQPTTTTTTTTATATRTSHKQKKVTDTSVTLRNQCETAAMTDVAIPTDDDEANKDEADKVLLFFGGGSCPCFCRGETATSPADAATTDSAAIQDNDTKKNAGTCTTTLISESEGCPFSGFEGPEKKLEVIFTKAPSPLNGGRAPCDGIGLRKATAEQWQSMLDMAHCKIISITSNRHLDCYVLSESSLFVYPHKMVLKTCGTTTLLHCIPRLLEIAAELGLLVERVFFSRKNYVFPKQQLFPHTSFVDETAFLDQYFSGEGYILGSVKQDHWYLYIADHRKANESQLKRQSSSMSESDEYNLEIMMHELDAGVMDQFFKRDDFVSSDRVTETSGISDLLPGSTIDAFMFDPCGYSMNGLLDNSYSTIHITPEKQCSFVSYETNVSAAYLRKHLNMSHADLVRRVLRTFKPGRATVTLRSCRGPDAEPALLSVDDEFVPANAKLYRFDGGVSLAFCNVFHETD